MQTAPGSHPLQLTTVARHALPPHPSLPLLSLLSLFLPPSLPPGQVGVPEPGIVGIPCGAHGPLLTALAEYLVTVGPESPHFHACLQLAQHVVQDYAGGLCLWVRRGNSCYPQAGVLSGFKLLICILTADTAVDVVYTMVQYSVGGGVGVRVPSR